MSTIESIEYFPLFDAELGDDAPAVSVAIGSGVAALGVPGALGGAGAVVLYFYSESRNGWGYVGVLSGSKIEGSQQVRALGSSCVAFGNTVIVGAAGDRNTPGRVFVLSPPYGAWSYTAIPVVAELSYGDSSKGDMFGVALAHCSDGTADYIAVGAPGIPPPRGRSGSGQVFIFRGLEPQATPWSTSSITNPNPAGTATDQFGTCVAINASGDGSGGSDGTLTLAVGAPGANEGEGAVYVGRTTEPGKWTSPFQFGPALIPTFPDAADEFHTEGFGASVALAGGVMLAVGAPNDPNFEEEIEGTGAVWLFTWADGSFVPNETQAHLYGPLEGMAFGASVAIPETSPADSNGALYSPAAHLFVGAPGAVSDQPTSVYRFVNDSGDGPITGGPFTPDAQYVGSSPQEGDGFGRAVAAASYQGGVWSMVGAAGNPKAEVPGGGYLYVDGAPAPTWMDTPTLISAPPLRWGGMPPDWWKKFTPQIERYLT
jgi:hypothetical protein